MGGQEAQLIYIHFAHMRAQHPQGRFPDIRELAQEALPRGGDEAKLIQHLGLFHILGLALEDDVAKVGHLGEGFMHRHSCQVCV